MHRIFIGTTKDIMISALRIFLIILSIFTLLTGVYFYFSLNAGAGGIALIVTSAIALVQEIYNIYKNIKQGKFWWKI